LAAKKTFSVRMIQKCVTHTCLNWQIRTRFSSDNLKDKDHLEDLVVDGTVKVKDKGKIHPITGHEVPEGE